MYMAQTKLALHGGTPVRKKEWPIWPHGRTSTVEAVMRVVESERWAISGPYMGEPMVTRHFEEAFASFCGATYCVATDHGSSALVVALEALDIGAGDEVIVPAITWVAVATAIVNINAVPVMVDVEESTLSVDPAQVEAAITDKTKAILPVHLYSGMADMDRLLAISERYRIPVVEDCSHIHGAQWRGQCAGTLGVMGAFSLQQSKVLTAGEGGAVITNNKELFRRLQQLRTDARVYTEEPLQTFDMEVVTAGEVQGTNYGLSELQAAVLLDQLGYLPRENVIREENATFLDDQLARLEGVQPLAFHSQVTRRSFYCYVVRYDRRAFANKSLDSICRALTAELQAPCFPIYEPMYRVSSYQPASKRRHQLSPEYLAAVTQLRHECPVAEQAYLDSICLPHWVLLGDQEDTADIASAFTKVQQLASDLPAEVLKDVYA